MEQNAAKTLKRPVRIIVRTSITQSISASLQSTDSMLNAHAKKQHIKLEKSAVILEQAELLLRNIISEFPWYTLTGINYTELKSGPGLIIEISGPERPGNEAVANLESMLRKNTGVKDLSVIIRYYKSCDITRNGRNLFGMHYSGTEPPLARKLEKQTKASIEEIRHIFPIHVEAQKAKDGWKIMADVTGARLIQSKEVKNIETKLTNKFSTPVKLYVYSKTEAVVEDNTINPLEFFSTNKEIKRIEVR